MAFVWSGEHIQVNNGRSEKVHGRKTEEESERERGRKIGMHTMIYYEGNGENMKNEEKQDFAGTIAQRTRWKKKSKNERKKRKKNSSSPLEIATEKWTDKNESQSVSASRV